MQARADDVQVLNSPPVIVQEVFVLPTRALFLPFLPAHLSISRFKRFADQVLAMDLVREVADADTMAQLRASASWEVPKTIPEKAKTNAEMQTVRIMSKPSRPDCLTENRTGMMTLAIRRAKQKLWPPSGLALSFRECPLCAVDSGGRRNTLVFEERWSVEDGISGTHLFHGQAEGGDLGSLATRGVDEFDWPEV
jgi:hypothetical protein